MEGYKRCETGEHLVLRSKTVMTLVKQEVSLERYGTRELGAKQRVDSFQPKKPSATTGKSYDATSPQSDLHALEKKC